MSNLTRLFPAVARAAAAALAAAAAVAACDTSSGTTPFAACAADAMTEQISMDLPPDTSPIGADLQVRGAVIPRAGGSIFALEVAGIPANQDAPNFTAFDVMIPLATLQELSLGAGAPRPIRIEVKAITSCEAAMHIIGDFPVTLRAVTSLTVGAELPAQGYLPTTKTVPVVIDVMANVEASGAPLVILPSQGTTVGATGLTLMRTSATTARASFVFSDPTKDGKALIVAQAAMSSTSTEILVAAPPTLNPPSTTVVAGTEFAVFVSNALPPGLRTDSIVGCTATTSAEVEVRNGATAFQGHGLTPLVEQDVAGHPIFRVHAFPRAAPKAVAKVTCYDTFGQSVTETYTVPE